MTIQLFYSVWQTTTTFSNNRFDFFRTPLQQQTEPPTSFSSGQQQAEGLVYIIIILQLVKMKMKAWRRREGGVKASESSGKLLHFGKIPKKHWSKFSKIQRSFGKFSDFFAKNDD